VHIAYQTTITVMSLSAQEPCNQDQVLTTSVEVQFKC